MKSKIFADLQGGMYAICALLCFLFLSNLGAQPEIFSDKPCVATLNAWQQFPAFGTHDLAGETPFNTDMATPQDFGCTGAENAVFAKLELNYNTSSIRIFQESPINDNVMIALIGLTDACPPMWPTTGTAYGEFLYQDANGQDMVDCGTINPPFAEWDLCHFTQADFDNLYLWVSSAPPYNGPFTILVEENLAPPNDECTNATLLDNTTSLPVQCETYTNLNACPDAINLSQPPGDPAEIPCFVDNPGLVNSSGVWFEFHTQADGELLDVTVSHSNSQDVNIALYSKDPDCDNLLPVFCREDDNMDGVIDDIQDYLIIPDITYLLYVYTDSALAGEFDLCYDIKDIPPCVGSAPRFFNQTTPICDLTTLDNYCLDMTNTPAYPDITWPGCGATIHDPNWFTFIAGADQLIIEVEILYCMNNNGIQIEMYELACDFVLGPGQPPINPTPGILGAPLANCQYTSSPQIGTITFEVNTLEGHLYGIVIDGWGGDLCHVEVDVLIGDDPPILNESTIDAPIFPDQGFGFDSDTVCAGATDVPFLLNGEVEGACRYLWELDGTPVPHPGSDTMALIDFPDPGTYEVCVSASNYCDTTDPVCVDVLVMDIPPRLTIDTICEGESYTWTDAQSGEMFGEYGPFNTSGQMIIQETLVNNYMCDIPYELQLYVKNENDENPTHIDTFYCIDELPIDLFGTEFQGPANQQSIQSISPSSNCDTFFLIDITVFGGEFSISTACDGQGNMVFTFEPQNDPDLYNNWEDQFQIIENDPDFSLEYEWSVIGQGSIGGNSNEITLSQGEIENLATGDLLSLQLQITIFYKGNVLCELSSPAFEYYLSLNFPEIISILGDSSYCPGQEDLKLFANTSDPIAPSGGSPDPVNFYHWYPPNGFEVEPPSTPNTDTLLLTAPDNPTENTLCLTVTTGSCMFTDSLCVDLEETFPVQPVLEPDNETCDTSWTFASITAENGEWQIIDTPASGNTLSFSNKNDPYTTVTVSEPGNYTFSWGEGPPSCAMYDTVSIDFMQSPTVSTYSDTCYFGNSFVLTIELEGSNSGFAIDPFSSITGEVNGNLFTSDTIPISFDPVTGNFGDTLYLVFTDNQGCVSDTIPVRLLCDCQTEIGEMATDTLEACEGDIVTAEYLGGHKNDGNDTLMYVLHTGDTATLGTVIDTSLDGSFSFHPSMTYGNIYYISMVIGNAVGPYVDLNDPCLAIAPGQAVIWYENPIANAGADTSVCGFSYSLNATPSVGNGSWKVVPANNKVEFVDPENPNTQVIAEDAGDYTFRWIETNGLCVDSADINITFRGDISALSTTICNELATKFDIKIVLTGGGGSYFLQNFSDSSLADTIYFHNDTLFATEIPKDSIVTLTINNEEGCSPLQFDVTTTCVCETAIGSLTGSTQQACSEDCIDARSLNYDTTAQFLDANDTLSWILHSSIGDTLLSENFIAQNPDGKFCFGEISNEVEFGDTIYLSRIAGNHIGNGQVDINDPCQQITTGVSVIFYELPIPDAGRDRNICGLSASLSANPTIGNGNWNFINGPSANVIFSDAGNSNSEVTVDEFGVYTFSWTENNEACIQSDTVEFQFLSPPETENISFSCNDIASAYTVSFDITSGDSSTYEVNGTVDGIINGNTFNSDLIPNDSSYTFYVNDGNGCDSAEVSGSYTCPCITQIGSIAGDQQHLCRNAEVLGISYDPSGEVKDGNDELIYVLLNDQDSIIATSNTPDFSYNPSYRLGETYYISAYLGSVINGEFRFDEKCTLSDGRIPVTWYDFPTPIIESAFDTITCSRTSIELDGSNSLGENLSFEWTTDGGEIESPANFDRVTITSAGEYTLTITDSLSGCTADTTIEIERSAEIPIAKIREPDKLTCNITDIELDGSQSSTGQDITYLWSTSNGNITSDPTATRVTVNVAGTYSLTVIDNSNNCETTSSVEVEVDREVPNVSAYVSGQLSCTVTNVTLDGSGSSTGSEYNYIWSTENGNITGGLQDKTTTANEVGDYVFTVLNSDNGCKDSIIITVTENPNALSTIEIEANNPLCHNETNGLIRITPIGGESPITYKLIAKNTGQLLSENQNGTFTDLEPDDYLVEVSDVNGCLERDSITLLNPPLLSINLSKSVVIERGDSTIVEAFLPPGAIYDTIMWDTDTIPYKCLDSACTLIRLSPQNELIVTATLIGGAGCIDEDEMRIIVKITRDVYIPNIFSPNGDGINDYFLPETGRNVTRVSRMSIFDRWGSLIYESRNFSPGSESAAWDGTYKGQELKPGVFIYKVEVEYDNGKFGVYNGTVTLTK